MFDTDQFGYRSAIQDWYLPDNIWKMPDIYADLEIKVLMCGIAYNVEQILDNCVKNNYKIISLPVISREEIYQRQLERFEAGKRDNMMSRQDIEESLKWLQSLIIKYNAVVLKAGNPDETLSSLLEILSLE